jgi:hypothetical protein
VNRVSKALLFLRCAPVGAFLAGGVVGMTGLRVILDGIPIWDVVGGRSHERLKAMS